MVSAGGKSRILQCGGGSTEGDVYVWILVLCISQCLLGKENRHPGNGAFHMSYS